MAASTSTITAAGTTLLVVFGDQLDIEAPVLQELDPGRDAVLMMEVESESRHVPSHKQRTVFFLSAMRHFAREIASRGVPLHYVALDDPQNSHDFATEITRAARLHGASRIVATEPGEWRVQRALEQGARDAGVALHVAPDTHFLCTREAFDRWASGRKGLVLEHFYRWQRKRLGVLVDASGQPEGGRWNFDSDNREPFKRSPSPAPPYQEPADAITSEVIALVESRWPDLPGLIGEFHWPVTREGARRALDAFIEQRLAMFGRYQDAMWQGEPFLHHSLLSPLLNVKLLDPRLCIDRAVRAHREGRATLASVEGFVRQILGWREFIRGVYWREGPDYASRNALGATGSLPDLYWTGETDLACLRECVGQVLEHGYGHHIQRLMITGNFALIAGVDPRAVCDWYLGMYVDAVDWATLPNTLGMAMHADGGVVGTKPYAASGKYVARMSNYCGSCRYDVSKRTGADACPFNVFYWDFLIRHQERFAANARMRPVLGHVERLRDDERREIRADATRLRDALGITPHGAS